MTEDLRTAYLLKERAELLLANLKKLKSECSVTQTDYKTLKAEYMKMLDDALPLIDSIKAELQKELDVKAKDLETLKQELGIVQARLKVGEISSETYRQRGWPILEGKVGATELEISRLKAMIGSTSSADIGGPKDISMPKPVAQAKWKQYLKYLMGAVSGLFSRLIKRVKVSKPVLFIVIIAGITTLLIGLVLGTNIPHSAKIAFLSDYYGQPSIHIIDADGNNERMLAYDPSLYFNPPVWSPNGTKIACVYWTSETWPCNRVMIVSKDGRNQKTVCVWDADY